MEIKDISGLIKLQFKRRSAVTQGEADDLTSGADFLEGAFLRRPDGTLAFAVSRSGGGLSGVVSPYVNNKGYELVRAIGGFNWDGVNAIRIGLRWGLDDTKAEELLYESGSFILPKEDYPSA